MSLLNPSLLLRRALALRCLVCGQGRIFRGWVHMHSHCASCGFRFEREEGYFLGAIYVNYGVTGAVLVAGVLLHYLLVPMPRWLLLGGGVGFGLLFPVWFSRWSRTLFMALDLSCHQPEEKDFVIRPKD